LVVAKAWELVRALAASNAIRPQLLTTQGWAVKRGLTRQILFVLSPETYLR